MLLEAHSEDPLSKSEGGEKEIDGVAIGLYISLNNSSEEKLDGIQTNNIASLLESSFETKAAMVRLPKDRGIFFNIPDSAVVQSQINSSTYLDIMSDESAIVSVANYQYFLLKKITPQILMALLLALLTAFTFLLLYRNLRKERQLAEIRSGLIANISHELNTLDYYCFTCFRGNKIECTQSRKTKRIRRYSHRRVKSSFFIG